MTKNRYCFHNQNCLSFEEKYLYIAILSYIPWYQKKYYYKLVITYFTIINLLKNWLKFCI